MNERLTTSTHRLTDLPGEKHPQKCQLCGEFDPLEYIKTGQGTISRWREHDHNDNLENLIIVLCKDCSNRVIKPHPRLYSQLQPYEPWPGCMGICLDCKLRSGISCTSKDARANGGAGVIITVPKPMSAMIDGQNYRGPIQLWLGPTSGCKQKSLE